MLDWLKKWISGAVALGALTLLAWWFVQQTSSFQAFDSMLRAHPAVSAEVGEVSRIKLPFFGYSFDWTDAKISPKFNVRVIGSKGYVMAHAEFHDGDMKDAWMQTTSGTPVPLKLRE